MKAAKLINTNTGEVLLSDNARRRGARKRRALWLWGETVKQLAPAEGAFPIWCTLTYSPKHEWHVRDISWCMRQVREYLKDDVRAYAWVMELHASGRPHYHLIVVSCGRSLPYLDRSGMWPFGATRRERADGREHYLLRYSKKAQDDGRYPPGARIHATWLCREWRASDTAKEYRHRNIPQWLRDKLGDDLRPETCRPAEGGGWWHDGRVIPSPWSVEVIEMGWEQYQILIAEQRNKGYDDSSREFPA